LEKTILQKIIAVQVLKEGLAKSVNPARGGLSVLALNPALMLPPNALKDERLFSCWFSRTLIVNADWLSYI